MDVYLVLFKYTSTKLKTHKKVFTCYGSKNMKSKKQELKKKNYFNQGTG
jgi:hypothetical protein